MRRAVSIARHIARGRWIALRRALRKAPPIEVLADEWLERYGNGKTKILYLGVKYDYNQPWRGLSYEEYNFLGPLKELDTTVLRLDLYTLYDLYGKRTINALIKEVVLRENPDILFNFNYLDIFDHEMLCDFRDNYPMRTLLWMSDDDVRFEEMRPLAKCFNRVITTIEHRHAQRKKEGYDSHFSQFYANTSLHRNLHLKKTHDVVFIGQKFGNRGEYVAYLQEHGINVMTFGAYWRRNSRLSQMEMIETINRARITLNFSSSPKDAKKKFIKGRVFEILSCGSFLLTEECDDLDTYFTPGKDLDTFKDKHELLSKVRFYLRNSAQRERIARTGERKVRSKYAFKDEFARIIQG